MTPSSLRLSVRPLLFALLALVTLATGCRTSGSADDVDPRDQYIGTYNGGYQASTLINSSLESSREAGTISAVITKSQVANQLYLDITYNSAVKQTLTAELNGSNFTIIDKQTESISFDNKTYTADYKASGQFVTNDFALNTTAETLQSGVTISRRLSITGTKK